MSPNNQSQLLEAIRQLDDQQIPLVLQFISSIKKNSTSRQTASQTVLERMGGYPKHFLEGSGDLSDRSVRKKIIAEKIRAKHQARHE
ncbi:hypothetical protein H6F44_03530 [Pseudanabaena sp. FACHB-1277]|jgi:glycyl-tRNA synthetase beta subunit|uniref:DUF2281 domain-containing protein n=1 Tax=Pseudanabaena cinerea FACHB-1277 TaxID=2949581 RepID=A0A926UQ56_9CYAN|nr:hypothetical protein [Pseudanabaena cinerea FACHB-1277]